jgi:MbtH protein
MRWSRDSFNPTCPVEEEARMSWEEDTTIYKVVVNHEEQYSIWPADRENALGWNDAGKQGTKAECLAYIKEVWTDMRPLSLRKKMQEMEKPPEGEETSEDQGE